MKIKRIPNIHIIRKTINKIKTNTLKISAKFIKKKDDEDVDDDDDKNNLNADLDDDEDDDSD